MRPRFANRGSQGAAVGDSEDQGGFNEAPIRESGKSRSTMAGGLVESRFNEAPIRESGKYRILGHVRGILKGFNEAPIRESGKSRTTGASPSTCPCFNEAPIRESGKYPVRQAVAFTIVVLQ